MTPEQLRAARKKIGLTQAALAEAVGVHRETINRYERGVLPIHSTVVLAVRHLETVFEQGPPDANPSR